MGFEHMDDKWKELYIDSGMSVQRDINHGSVTLPNAITNIKHSHNINVLM